MGIQQVLHEMREFTVLSLMEIDVESNTEVEREYAAGFKFIVSNFKKLLKFSFSFFPIERKEVSPLKRNKLNFIDH